MELVQKIIAFGLKMVVKSEKPLFIITEWIKDNVWMDWIMAALIYKDRFQIYKLPGELGMAFTTTISSYSFFVEGKKYKTNPIEKMTRRRRPHKLIETWLHFLFLSF